MAPGFWMSFHNWSVNHWKFGPVCSPQSISLDYIFFINSKNSRKISKFCRWRSGSTTRPNLVGLKRPNWRLTQIGSEMWHGPRHLENREQSLLAAPKTDGLLSGRQILILALTWFWPSYLPRNFHRKDVQWTFNYRICPVFKWLICVR